MALTKEQRNIVDAAFVGWWQMMCTGIDEREANKIKSIAKASFLGGILFATGDLKASNEACADAIDTARKRKQEIGNAARN